MDIQLLSLKILTPTPASSWTKHQTLPTKLWMEHTQLTKPMWPKESQAKQPVSRGKAAASLRQSEGPRQDGGACLLTRSPPGVWHSTGEKWAPQSFQTMYYMLLFWLYGSR